MPDAEFEAILTGAAEEGAKRALADVGLDGDEAALDIRDLRSLVDCIRVVRRTAMQTAVHLMLNARGGIEGDLHPTGRPLWLTVLLPVRRGIDCTMDVRLTAEAVALWK